MSTSVTVYRSDDASAPVLNANAASINSLLRACLVTGYGSKSAAGWSEPFTTSGNVAVFLMQNVSGCPRRYLRVDDSSANTTPEARIVSYESMSGLSSGTNDMPTAAQVSGGAFIRRSSSSTVTTRPWILIANGLGFVLHIRGSATDFTGTVTSADYTTLYGVFNSNLSGDLYRNRMVAQVATVNVSARGGVATQGLGTAATGVYVERGYTSTGTAQNIARVSGRNPQTTLGSSFYNAAFPDPLIGGQRLTNVLLGETTSGRTTERGVEPGIWCPLAGGSLPAYNASTAGAIAVETNGTWGF